MADLNLTLKIWRQDGPTEPGGFKTYDISDLNTHMSFLEMLDVLNENLVNSGDEPVAFDHDCREGICGMCSMDRWKVQQLVSSICDILMMAIR
jgi:succinate dehydrogenase / fumarate reductase iron-sulfur subunit